MSGASDLQLFEQLVSSANQLFLSDGDSVVINGVTKPTLKKIYADFLASMYSYTTVAAGLAATSGTGTNNRFFTVPATGSDFEIRYRNDAGVAVEIARSPSASSVANGKLTSGILGFTASGQALNGATAITESTVFLGFAIPVGATGASSYVHAQLLMDQTALAKLVGSTVEVVAQYEVTAGFLSSYPSTPRIRVGRGASYVDVAPTWSEATQSGTSLVVRMRYVVTADDLYLSPVYQIPINPAAATTAASLKVKAVSYFLASYIGVLTSPEDFMLNERLSPLSLAIANAQSVADSALISSGSLVDSLANDGQAFNGAVFITDSTGKKVGLSIPTGQTGATAYLTSLTGVAALVGCTLKFTVKYNTTVNFNAETPTVVSCLRVVRSSGTVTLAPTGLIKTQSGTVLTMTFSYVVTAEDLTAGPILQVSPSAVATDHNRSAQLADVYYSIASVPAGSKSGGDMVLAQRFLLERAATKAEVQVSIDKARLSSGELVADATSSGQVFNGAAFITTSGKVNGMRFPPATTGLSSYLASLMPLSAAMLAKLVGCMVRIVVAYDTTANFLAETPKGGVQLQIKRAGVVVNVSAATIATAQAGTVMSITMTYMVTATDESITPVFQVSSGAVAQDHERTMTLKSMAYTLDSLASGAVGTPEDLQLDVKLQAIKDQIPSTSTVMQIKVGPTGVYATPKLAMAAITDASVSKQYELLIDTSVIYDQDANWSVKDYVHMTADGPGYAWIHYENPDNVDPATIPLTQTFWDNKTSILTRLKVTGRNVRYPIHSDSSGADKDRIQTLRQCWIEHLGNAGAQAYQDSISSGVTVWQSQHAWGCGTSSGMVIESVDTVFRSPSTAFYFHTRQLFAKGSRQTLRNSRMLTTNDSGEAIAIQPLGSMQEDVLQLNGCEVQGFMSYSASPWIPDTLVNQPANHSEIKVMGAGNTPFAFKITDFGRALKIESTDTTSASKIEVSGDAVPIVFGRQVFSMPGVVGIKGYVYGWADISGVGVGINRNVFITSLGQRLGDCTTVNKTLGVKINGGTTTTITFNQNYTAQSNATILAAINAALGSLAVATAYDIGGRYRPEMLDEERSLKNNSVEGILMGMAVAWDGHNKKIRKMTASDAPALFAGIVMEDIYPGQWGRVKTCGWMLNTDLYQFTGSPSYHQVFYIDPAVPGKPTLTVGTNAIMRDKASNIVEVAPK